MNKNKPYSQQKKRRFIFGIGFLLIFFSALIALPVNSSPDLQTTPTGIWAEALGEANLRAGAGIEYDQVGTIYAGTRYNVLGQHEFYPWILIQYGDTSAWVYADLVTLSVSLSQVPIVNESALTISVAPTPTATTTPAAIPLPNQPVSASDTPAPTLADTFSVYLEALDEINVRFGPGIDYPRIERIQPGQRYGVISRHAIYPWLLIDLPSAPDGVGWVYQDVVNVTGNIFDLPVITAEEVGWPTLTPTPPFVVTEVPPWTGTPSSDNAATVDLQLLGEQILNNLLAAGFAPEEDRIGSVFVLDLQTGENFSLGRDIVYSGMSLNKISLLVTYFRYADQPPTAHEAELIANTMICSGNHTANGLLAILGNGDELAGAQRVTDTLHELGLHNTFMLAPFDLSMGRTPTPQPYPIYAPATQADQTRTNPDPFNQVTPDDLGWLLSSVYQCAMDENGPLMDTFPGQFTPTECRQIIRTMSSNQINVLTEAGVPKGTTVAHKHGWVNDTHGDAAIVFTPGGDFVLTMILHQPDWLPYELSWPTMAEIARAVYNAYNPDQPLDSIHPETVDETCDLTDNPLLTELTAPYVPPFE